MSTIKKINVNNVSYEIGSSSTSNIEVRNDNSMSNLNIGDENGNIIAEFKEGHIKTKNFDSRTGGRGFEVIKSEDDRNILILK